MDIKKIIVKNYKCFDEIELSNIKPINIVIGKNNIGKSSILDLFEMIYNQKIIPAKTNLYVTKEMNEELIKSVFFKGHGGGGIPKDHFEFGKEYIGYDLTFERKNNNINDGPADFELYNSNLPKEQVSYWNSCARKMHLESKISKRILAERNIFPEDNDDSMNIDSNGNGLTRIITNYLNRSRYDEDLVKTVLLNKLNQIMGEDANFTEIITQQIDTSNGTKWEIFLREEGKGRISLSDSGSGLKTILMVLVYTILVPDIEKRKLSEYIFLFEELENSLHPSLQRRLLSYIESLINEGCMFFLSTHSNVALDSYQNSELVSIIYVQKELDTIIAKNVTNKVQKNYLLDALGVKASDLLQANGIIWVEGPSDRLYINKWLEMFGVFNFREGKNYQCVFYGGRLLSNLTLEDENELINLMTINRNAIIILDSDKKTIRSPLNNTKRRILEEARKNNIFTWVTKGREIENYISDIYLKKIYNKNKSRQHFGQFQNIEEFLNKLKKGEGNKFLRNKTEFARKILNDSCKEDFKKVYDLEKMISRVEREICSWNYYE